MQLSDFVTKVHIYWLGDVEEFHCSIYQDFVTNTEIVLHNCVWIRNRFHIRKCRMKIILIQGLLTAENTGTESLYIYICCI